MTKVTITHQKHVKTNLCLRGRKVGGRRNVFQVKSSQTATNLD